MLTFARHPDIPRGNYADGRLGVVLPTYARSYLIVAYRYFEGIGLNGGERAQVMAYWHDRNRANPWDRTAVDWGETWAKESGAGEASNVRKDRGDSGSGYVYYRGDDAFRVATFTLRERARRAGAKSAAFLNWLAGQKVVFGDAEKWPALPADSPKWLVQDRAYQQAAWHFYRQEVAEAVSGFRAIAVDATSPWRVIARYLVARTYTVALQTDAKWKEAAEKEIRSILADASLGQIHGAVKSLRRRNGLVTEPDVVMRDLAETLVKPRVDLSLRQDIWDYIHLYDAVEERKQEQRLVGGPTLSQWLYCFQNPNVKTSAKALERWRQSGSTAWLVAALSGALPTGPGVGEMLETAAKVRSDSPAFSTLAYHRARVLIGLHREDEAEKILDEAMATEKIGASSQNLLLSLKSQSVADLPRFLSLLPRRPMLVSDVLDEGETALGMGGLARPRGHVLSFSDARFFNEQAPLELLAKAALDTSLPRAMAAEFQRVALMRSLILEDHRFESLLAEALAKSSAGYRKLADAKGDSGAMVAFVIHQPEFRPYFLSATGRDVPNGSIDDYRDNFWPPYVAGHIWYEAQGHWGACANASGEEPAASYRLLSERERQTGDDEFRRLLAAGSAASFYTTYAKRHSEEGPELLEGSIRASRYSLAPQSVEKQATEVWRLLMRKYPKSAAAEKWRSGYIFHGSWSDRTEYRPSVKVRNFFEGVSCRYQP